MNHSEHSWQKKSRLVLTPKSRYDERKDKDGLTMEKRRKIEDIKDKINYHLEPDPLETD